MTLPDVLNPSPEVVDQLRQSFRQKMDKDAAKIPREWIYEAGEKHAFLDG